MFVSFKRIFTFATRNFFRNFWLSTMTISVVALALLAANLLVVINALTGATVQAITNRLDVSVTFAPQVGDEIIASVRTVLLAMPEVRDVVTVSPEEALARLRERQKNNPAIAAALEELGENPLGVTLAIKARDSADYPAILTVLNDPAYAQFIESRDFEDHRILIERVNGIARRVERGALAVSLIFTLIAVLIVFNTMRIAIATHRAEIKVMKLVGASHWFVRGPFLIEGIFYAVAATIIALLVALPLVRWASPSVANFFDATPVNLWGYYVSHLPAIFFGELVGAAVLTFISASVAVSKYIKV